MSLNIIVLAGFYEPARHAVRYATTLAEAVRGQLVLLHVNHASLFDPYELVEGGGESYRQQELLAQTATAEALRRWAQSLHVPATVELATELLPDLARELAERYQPALFVMGQPPADQPDYSSMTTMCADLLRATHLPLLVVPATAPAEQAPHRFLIAADQEPFALGAAAQALRPVLNLLATEAVVAHVSGSVADDNACAAALCAVCDSKVVEFLTPELRGYRAGSSAEGLLAAVADTAPDLVITLGRQRSFLSDLFHRSVTARLLGQCPVPVLVLPTAAEVPQHRAAPAAAVLA